MHFARNSIIWKVKFVIYYSLIIRNYIAFSVNFVKHILKIKTGAPRGSYSDSTITVKYDM